MLPASSSKFIQSTTQQYLEIYDVTNDIIILKDGSVAMVIQTNAMNFGLLSEEEQDATIYTYAGMLNSLSFPVQILIRSQKKDVTTYLNYLKTQEQALTHPTRKTQIRRYREFIEALVQETNILDKKFYIILPLTPVEIGLVDSSPIPTVKLKKVEDKPLDKIYILDKAKTILEPRRDHLLSQLGRIGLLGKQMKTQDLIQLLYSIYNPEAANDQHMTDSKAYTMPIVEASMKGVSQTPSLQSFTKEGSTQTSPPPQTRYPENPQVIHPQPTVTVETPTIQTIPKASSTVNNIQSPPTQKAAPTIPQQSPAPTPAPAEHTQPIQQPIPATQTPMSSTPLSQPTTSQQQVPTAQQTAVQPPQTSSQLFTPVEVFNSTQNDTAKNNISTN